MKKILGIAVLVLLAITGVASAFDKVTVTSTCDLVSSDQINGTLAQGTTYTGTFYFPVTLEQLNSTGGVDEINITADSATASTTINLTVNGVAVASNYVITGGASKAWTFADLSSAGVDMSKNYLTVSVEAVANNTVSTWLNVSGSNMPVTSNLTYSVSEVKLSKPQVKYHDIDSFYSVKQTVAITQDSSYNITNVTCTFAYPDNAINKGDLSYNYGSLNVSEQKSHTVYFQKRGPYFVEAQNVAGSSYVTTMKIYSPENLTASFEFTPTKSPWSRYFPNFCKCRLSEITLNGNTVSWTDPEGVIISDLTLNKGYNTINVTYSKPSQIMPAVAVLETPTPIYEQDWFPWAIFTVIVIVAMLVIYGSKHERR